MYGEITFPCYNRDFGTPLNGLKRPIIRHFRVTRRAPNPPRRGQCSPRKVCTFTRVFPAAPCLLAVCPGSSAGFTRRRRVHPLFRLFPLGLRLTRPRRGRVPTLRPRRLRFGAAIVRPGRLFSLSHIANLPGVQRPNTSMRKSANAPRRNRRRAFFVESFNNLARPARREENR